VAIPAGGGKKGKKTDDIGEGEGEETREKKACPSKKGTWRRGNESWIELMGWGAAGEGLERADCHTRKTSRPGKKTAKVPMGDKPEYSEGEEGICAPKGQREEDVPPRHEGRANKSRRG